MSTTSAFSRSIFATLMALGLGCLAAPSCASAQPAYPTLVSQSGPYELAVLMDGAMVPTFQHGGETYVLGQLGARYTLRVVNNSPRRVEAVVSVDGRDAIDGASANYKTKRGYLISAWSSVDIEGWRLSQQQVAAFRFSTVGESYAAARGNAREVGVIGVAVFPERERPVVRYYPSPRVYPRPYPSPYPPPGPYPYPMDDKDGRSSRNNGSFDEEQREAPSSEPSKSGQSGRAHGMGGASAADSGSAAAPRPETRPGLGTEFGERRDSYVENVSFVRASSRHPAAILGARYNDRSGLIARGIDVDGCSYGYASGYCWSNEEELRGTATPFPGSPVHNTYAPPPRGWRWR